MMAWAQTIGFLCTLAIAAAQNGYPRQGPQGFGRPDLDNQINGDEIPGQAGVDYPLLASVPITNFRCDQLPFPGYYADQEAFCQVFYICQKGGRGTGFLCPNGTLFNQEFLVCDWWSNVDCARAPEFYGVNEVVARAMEAVDATNPRATPGAQPFGYDPFRRYPGNVGVAPSTPTGTNRPPFGFPPAFNNYRPPNAFNNPFKYNPTYPGPVNARYPYNLNYGNAFNRNYPNSPANLQYGAPFANRYDPRLGGVFNGYPTGPFNNFNPYRPQIRPDPLRSGFRNPSGNGDKGRYGDDGSGRRYPSGSDLREGGRPAQGGNNNNNNNDRGLSDADGTGRSTERYRDRGADDGYFYDRPRNELRGRNPTFGSVDPDKAYLPPAK